ncbi:MAG: hypothetical protein ACKPKO_63845, partial [Candidatus Fonsibacter sp.]
MLFILMSGTGRPRMYPVAMPSPQDLHVAFIHWEQEGDLIFARSTPFSQFAIYCGEASPGGDIENVRGLTFKGNATLLAYVKECLRG